MKIYVSYEEYQTMITQLFTSQIELVDSKNQAEWIIGGNYSIDDYNPLLKGIIVPWTGLDSIDLDAIKKHHLKLYNTTVHSDYVAEKAIQLMFALLGNIIPYHTHLKQGNWSYRNNKERVPWVSVIRKNIGIYGYGRIGQLIHDYLRPFHVNVTVIDRNKTYRDVKLVKTLKELIERSDIIFIATPLTKATEHIFDREHFTLMKDKYLINVGRGKIIEEAALFNALNNQTLKGFASDVWFRYPKNDEVLTPSSYPIETFDNVVMSPHCGGFSIEAPQVRMLKVMDYIDQILENDFSEALNIDAL